MFVRLRRQQSLSLSDDESVTMSWMELVRPGDVQLVVNQLGIVTLEHFTLLDLIILRVEGHVSLEES